MLFNAFCAAAAFSGNSLGGLFKPMSTAPKALTLRSLFFLALTTMTLLAGVAPRAAAPGERTPLSKSAIAAAYGKLPLSFETNEGQTDRRVKFLSRGAGYGLFLTSTEAVLSLKAGNGRPADKDSVLALSQAKKRERQHFTVLRVRLEHANSNAKVSGTDELAGKSNYFIGNDAAKWRRNIPTFGRVKYQQVYSGVDLVYYGNQRALEYDFVLAPGADPRQIELRFDGAKRLRLDADGNLIVSIAGGEVIEHKPVIYQDIGGMRRWVAGGYELTKGQRIGFKLTDYDAHRSLTIDPSLAYSTYLGGSSSDSGIGIAVDSLGNAYVTGGTYSDNFPTTAGAFQTIYSGDLDAYVSKLNSSGTALVYSTYLGGNNPDEGEAMAVDQSGNAYITGSTSASNFPTTSGAFQTTLHGSQNLFVSKLNRSGSALLYSTYLGGSSFDSGVGIAMSSSGDAYVTGYTLSSDFPTTSGAFQTTLHGSQNAFVSKLNRSGSALVYSTYLGGSGIDYESGITVDAWGNAYVTGYTNSPDFPTTAGALQTTYGGNGDAFVSKLNRSGSALVYSTYLGGSGGAGGYAIAVDWSGNAYVTGNTCCGDFPTTAGAFQITSGGGNDAFVSKLNRSGSALAYSTYLGGSGFDSGIGIAVDWSGNAYVTGSPLPATFRPRRGRFRPLSAAPTRVMRSSAS
jgi:hypothetical protein